MPQKIKYLQKDQIERLFSSIKDRRDRALFAVIYYYGLRVSEATLMKLEDIDFTRGRIYIRRVKGGIGGERPLFKVVAKALRAYLKARCPSGDALFTGRQGSLSKKRIQQLFKRYAKDAGLGAEYSVHCLRHSIATHWLESGADPADVQDHLGHAKPESTRIYAQITDRRREEVYREMEDSDSILKM